MIIQQASNSIKIEKIDEMFDDVRKDNVGENIYTIDIKKHIQAETHESKAKIKIAILNSLQETDKNKIKNL